MSLRPNGLYAVLETDRGSIVCVLEHEKTPLAVTSFVGLAEGTIRYRRGHCGDFDTWTWDEDPFDGKLPREPFFDGLSFWRALDSLVSCGSHRNNGYGDPGYRFRDEFHPDLRFDGPGKLGLMHGGPNTNGSQFFITRAEFSHADGSCVLFARVVEGLDVVHTIEGGDVLRRVRIERVGEEAQAFRSDQAAFDALEHAEPPPREAYDAGRVDVVPRLDPHAAGLEIDAILERQDRDADSRQSDGRHPNAVPDAIRRAVRMARAAVSNAPTEDGTWVFLHRVILGVARAKRGFDDADEDGFASATFHEMLSDLLALHVRSGAPYPFTGNELVHPDFSFD